MYRTNAILVTLIILCSSTSYAGSTTLTTYYPAPNGDYDNLNAKNLSISETTSIEGDILLNGETSLNGTISINQAGRLVSDGTITSNGTFNASSLTMNDISLKPDGNNGIKFTQGNTDLLYIGNSFNGVAVASNRNLIVEGGGLIITDNVTSFRNKPVRLKDFPIDLTTQRIAETGTDTTKKIALHYDQNAMIFSGFGLGSDGLEFYSFNNMSQDPNMFLDKNGNLGIGIITPHEKLHVIGNIVNSGNITTSTLQADNVVTHSVTISNSGNTVASMNQNGTITGKFILPTSNGCPDPCTDGMVWFDNN